MGPEWHAGAAATTTNGTVSFIATIDTNFDSVGIEWHPVDKELYACTNASGNRLLQSDTETGASTLQGMLPHNCNNLASPWTTVQCVEDIEVP